MQLKIFSFSHIKPFLAKIPAYLGVLLLLASLFVMWRELQHLSLHDILTSLKHIPFSYLWKGVGVTCVAYFLLSFYDGLACCHVEAEISWKRSAFVAFCSYVLSHNLGCAAISGNAVRYRLYRSWGVPGVKIAGIITFCSLTYLLGTIALIGFVLLFEPQIVPVLSHFPRFIPYIIGGCCYILLLLYIFFSIREKTWHFKKWSLKIPNWKIAITQIIASSADMSMTALIAWCVIGPLPEGCDLNFGAFLAIYILSYTAGLMASVPGGLGVFDGAMLLSLSPYLPVSHIMGAILVFRLFYYVIPLILAGLMFVGHELFMRSLIFSPAVLKKFVPKLGSTKVILESEADFSVAVATSVQALLGVTTIIYSLLLPLPYFHSTQEGFWIQVGVFFLMLSGVVLIGLAVGLSQRVALAWRLSVITHCCSLILLFLVHALLFTYIIVCAVLMMLFTFKQCYYRQAHWRVAPLSPAILTPFTLWLVGILGMLWVGHQRHVGPIWWRAMIYDAHTAKGRWFLGFAAICCVVALCSALRRTRIEPLSWEEVREKKSISSEMEKELFIPDGVISDEGKCAFIAFKLFDSFIIGVEGFIVDTTLNCGVIWRLRDYVEQENSFFAILQKNDNYADIYNDIGLNHFSIGAYHLFCEVEHYGRICAILEPYFLTEELNFMPLSFSDYSFYSSL